MLGAMLRMGENQMEQLGKGIFVKTQPSMHNFCENLHRDVDAQSRVLRPEERGCDGITQFDLSSKQASTNNTHICAHKLSLRRTKRLNSKQFRSSPPSPSPGGATDYPENSQ